MHLCDIFFAMILVFLLYALFASVFTISKTGLLYTQPFFFVGSRMVFAGLVLLAYQFLFRREKFVFKKTNLLKISGLAFFAIYLTNTFEFWGLQYLTSSKTCFIYSLSPFVSALFSYLIFTEKLSIKKWIGMLIGFAGMLPVLLSQSTTEELAGQFFIFSWPELAVMGAAVSSVYGWILLKQLVHDNGCSAIMANGLGMLLGGSFALVHSYYAEEWNPIPVTEYLPFIVCALLLILISNLICYNLYGVLLKRFSATFMSFAGLSTPLFSALFGWLFLQETISWQFFASLTIVSFGLVFFYLEELKTVETKQVQPI
jgi:drug/metabolite transporter (DMT)-like permease